MKTLVADGLKVVARLLLSVASRIDHPKVVVYDSNWKPLGEAKRVPGLDGVMLETTSRPPPPELHWDGPGRDRGD